MEIDNNADAEKIDSSDEVQKDDISTELNGARVKRSFHLCMLGVLLSFAPIRALLALQTSINIEDGLGSLSGTIFNFSATATGLFLAPVIIRAIGAKRTLMLSEVSLAAFVFGNAFGVFYSMVPGSLLGGIGEGLIWPCISLYNVYFAKEYKKYGSKTIPQYILDFTGLFFVTVGTTQIIGNLTSLLLLSFASFKNNDDSISNETSKYVNATAEKNFMYCGAHDCQEPNITSRNKSQYVPQDRTKIYILVAVFCLSEFAAVFTHFMVIPKMDKQRKNCANNKLLKYDQQSDNEESGPTVIIEVHAVTRSKKVLVTLFETLKHAVSIKQLLLTPLQIYVGMIIGLVNSEITRAYVSCILGVEKVGLAVGLYGVAMLIASMVLSKLAGKIGTSKVMFFSLLIDLLTYSFCLLWEPGSFVTWLAILPAFTFGASGAIWQILTNSLCPMFFKEAQDLGFSMWNMNVMLGVTFEFAWSSYVCVKNKLLFHIAYSIFAVVMHGVAEYVYNRNTRTSAKT